MKTSFERDKAQALLSLGILVPAPTLGVLFAMWIAPGSRFGETVFVLCKITLLLLPALWSIFVLEEKISLSPMRKGGAIFGALSGVLIASAILMVWFFFASKFVSAEEMRKTCSELGLCRLDFYICGALYWSFINSMLEEYVWRSFVFKQSRILIGKIPAIVFVALAFAVHHAFAMAYYFPWQLVLLACAGIVFGSIIWSCAYSRYESIWPGYISHVFADLAIFAVGYQILF